MARIGPVVLETVGDEYTQPARIAGATWDGSTSAGDVAEVRCRETGALLFAIRTADTNTFLGAMVPPTGVHAPNGFKLTVLSAGRVCVYLKEG